MSSLSMTTTEQQQQQRFRLFNSNISPSSTSSYRTTTSDYRRALASPPAIRIDFLLPVLFFYGYNYYTGTSTIWHSSLARSLARLLSPPPSVFAGLQPNSFACLTSLQSNFSLSLSLTLRERNCELIRPDLLLVYISTAWMVGRICACGETGKLREMGKGRGIYIESSGDEKQENLFLFLFFFLLKVESISHFF